MRFLILFLIAVAGCTAPHADSDTPLGDRSSKWQDNALREIHELKNARNTTALIEYLNDPSPQYRAEAAMVLGSVQDTASVHALRALITDEFAEVRMMAAFALGQIGTPAAAHGLIELIDNDTTTVVRTEALEALGKTGTGEAADFLLHYEPNYFFDEAGHSWGIYRLALKASAGIHHERIMMSRLSSAYEETRLAAVHFFTRHKAQIDADSLNMLAGLAAKDRSAEVRMAAASAMSNCNITNRQETLATLALQDVHPGVRVNALRALSKTGGGEHAAIEALYDSNSNVAIAAADFFRRNPGLAEAERIRTQALTHPSLTVRGLLFETLLQLDGEPQETILTEIFREIRYNPDCAVSLVTSLRRTPESRPFLDSLVFHAEPRIATPALETLFELYALQKSNCTEWQSLFSRLKDKADTGLLALLGNRLRDPGFAGRPCFLVDESWVDLTKQIKLPSGLEAHIELSEALRDLSDTLTISPISAEFVDPDWAALSTFGQQPIAEITTNKGSFSLILLSDDAPVTVSHFVNLASQGFFDGRAFHRVVPNFVIQTGCPRGDGYGSGDELLRSEFSPLHYGPGVAGIASAGKDTESTQWFVTHCTTPHLDGRYTIFGAVIDGMDVVWELAPDDVIEQITISSFDH